jgi:ribosome maturation factor RimP
LEWQFCRVSPLSRRIAELAGPVCEACGVDLYLVEVVQGQSRSLVRVTIDAIDGVDVNDCAKVSQRLSAALDVEDPIKGRYNLEVSSPGLDRPLRHLDDARRYVGQKARVETGEPVSGRRRFVGILSEVGEDWLDITVDGKRFRVSADGVRKANLVYEFPSSGRQRS